MKTEIVETRSGRLRGRSSDWGLFFGGVPFASPPEDRLRFAPPQPATPWSGIRDAFQSGPSAPQLAVGKLGPISHLARLARGPMSENCLTLDVSTPRADGGKRPVLVWLHGGAFVLGAGSTFLYDQRVLVERGDVVVVSPNYRLGALGFLNLTALSSRPDAPSNLGLLDQIAALEWVRDNIAQFGGDPENVTVFGESAGAMSLGALLTATTGLFRRAILQSGAAGNISTPNQATYVAERFLQAVGLDANDLEGLRALPVATVLEAQRAVLLGESARIGRLPWQPSVDGRLVADQPLALVARGEADNTEVLIGTNLDEWKLFTAGSFALRAMSFGELERRIERMLAKTGHGELDATAAVALYRDLTSRRRSQQTAYEAWVAFRSDEYFRMPALALADSLAGDGSAVYLYRFDYPVPAFRRALGSCHAAEVPLVFGTQRTRWLRPLYLGSRKANHLAETIQDAWLAFAHRGVPRDAEAGAWPRHDPTGRETRVLAAPGRSDPILADPESEARNFWMDGRVSPLGS